VDRTYAGILGPLALTVLLLQGLIAGAGTVTTVLHAWLGLLAFAILGYVTGRIANALVEESVRSKLLLELAAQEKGAKPASPNMT
jgi:hypothetical protein